MAISNDAAQSATVKILGREYKLRTDLSPEHLEQVAAYVDRVLREVRSSTADTQDAAILASLNIASELMRVPETTPVPRERIQALIDLIETTE